jgi:hypothetical protein
MAQEHVGRGISRFRDCNQRRVIPRLLPAGVIDVAADAIYTRGWDSPIFMPRWLTLFIREQPFGVYGFLRLGSLRLD